MQQRVHPGAEGVLGCGPVLAAELDAGGAHPVHDMAALQEQVTADDEGDDRQHCYRRGEPPLHADARPGAGAAVHAHLVGACSRHR